MIDELRCHNACNIFFRDFLDVIEHEMLVIHQDEHGSDTASTRAESHEDATLEVLAVPGQNCGRRKSSGDIFRTLGTLKEELEQDKVSLQSDRSAIEAEEPVSVANGHAATSRRLPDG